MALRYLLLRSASKLTNSSPTQLSCFSRSSSQLLHRHYYLNNTFRFSTSSSSVVGKQSIKSAADSRRDRWRRIARIAYYIRIPALVLSVYGIGYQQGIMDFAREKETMEAKLLQTVLAGVGCTSREDREGVLIAHEGDWRNLLSRYKVNFHRHHATNEDNSTYEQQYKRMVMLRDVAIVGEKIIRVARMFVKSKQQEAIKEAAKNLPPEVLDNEYRLHEALEENKEVDMWSKARRHMQGEWKFVLIPSVIPNAFVSEILPHRIFITTSFLQKFIESKDELALTLGHEVSHLILGHSSNRNSFEVGFRTVEILLLSLDPTEGLLSIAFMSFLASVRHALGAEFSRNDEREADELGLKLTAMACFDTREASRVFHKMHLDDVESGKRASASRAGLISFFDSHPPSEERYHSLLEGSGEENRDKYEETTCATLKAAFLDALKAS